MSGQSPGRDESRGEYREAGAETLNMTMVPIAGGPRRSDGRPGAVRRCVATVVGRCPAINGFLAQPPGRRAPRTALRPRGRHRDRSRCGPAARTPAPDAVGGRRRVPGTVALRSMRRSAASRSGSAPSAPRAVAEDRVDRGAVDALQAGAPRGSPAPRAAVPDRATPPRPARTPRRRGSRAPAADRWHRPRDPCR